MIHSILLVLLLQALPSASGAGGPVRQDGAPAVGPAVAPAPVQAPPSPAVTALRADLERLIESPGWTGDRWSVMVVSLDRGDTLFVHGADEPLTPASNLKLFTSAAALYFLGPDFRYGTYLLTDGRIERGRLEGDLILYGTGDPTLSDRFYPTKTTVWEAFADSLAALGVTEIGGDVVGDASYFGGTTTGVGWQESYMNAWYAAPANSLSFNENIVTLRIRPGAQAGWRPAVQLVPGGEGIGIVNQATTIRRGRTRIDVSRAAYDGPIVIRGQIATGSEAVWSAVPVSDPARFSAAVLREVLSRRGIQVRGSIRSIDREEDSPVTGRSVFAPAFDDRPPLRVLAVHQSPSMQEILGVVNKKSHNLFAESVLRKVGRVVFGQGTVEAGARAVAHMLRSETGVESLDLRILDGSGLSVLNRASARSIVHLLGYMASSPLWEPFRATLPEAGDAEGLRRMYQTAAQGNLRAKTGTIDRVSALSGYVGAANGERLAFSIISNEVPSTWRAKRVEDAIGARLAAFTRPTGALPAAEPLAQAMAAPQPARAEAADAALRPGGGKAASAAETRTHTIRKGDTLDGIAKRYGTTVRALQGANPGVTPKRLIPGRRLRIP